MQGSHVDKADLYLLLAPGTSRFLRLPHGPRVVAVEAGVASGLFLLTGQTQCPMGMFQRHRSPSELEPLMDTFVSPGNSLCQEDRPGMGRRYRVAARHASF